jgi:hypothetical protein
MRIEKQAMAYRLVEITSLWMQIYIKIQRQIQIQAEISCAR